jgi:hypothetical protein
MNVREMITWLQALDQDADVHVQRESEVRGCEGNHCDWVMFDPEGHSAYVKSSRRLYIGEEA